MPAAIEKLTSEQLESRVTALAVQMRQRRKVMGVSVTTAAQAAGVSRVTWHRMEKGEITVTIGAWFNALAVLGLEFGIGLIGRQVQDRDVPGSAAVVPVSIALADFPQLAALAWHVQGVSAVSAREAFDIYQRNERHINHENLTPGEAALITNLGKVLGGLDGI